MAFLSPSSLSLLPWQPLSKWEAWSSDLSRNVPPLQAWGMGCELCVEDMQPGETAVTYAVDER